MMSSLTIAATDSDIGRMGVNGGAAAAGAGREAGATTAGGDAAAVAAPWACTLKGRATATRAVTATAPRAPWPVTLRARIISEIIPSFGRVRPQFLSAIDWSAQCGER